MRVHNLQLMLLFAAASSPAIAAGDRCETLRNAVIPQGAVTSVEKHPQYCRVTGVSRPTQASNIRFEVWLPSDTWNGRYYQLGNGGFAGNIHTPSLAAEVQRGNAAASTDTGHQGTGFDASWASDNPEQIIDYGYRSIKTTSDAARILIAQYYGRPAKKRYFAGCSNGGRQALIAAQRYPADWDGILAGAPANLWTQQLSSFRTVQYRLRSRPENWLNTNDLGLIRRSALASCPADTVKGSVAPNPSLCKFRPHKLQCNSRSQKLCLTPAQVDSVRTIIQAGFDPTSATPENWGRWITNPSINEPSQLTFAEQSHRHLLQQDLAWNILSTNLPKARDIAISRATLNADSEDMSAFEAHGGKIISYFGWADAVISPNHGVRYYQRVAKRAGGVEALHHYYRLFMIPGMEHCQGGPAGYAFGQSISAPATQTGRLYDIRIALEDWVEKDMPPEELNAVAGNNAASPNDWPSVLEIKPWHKK